MDVPTANTNPTPRRNHRNKAPRKEAQKTIQDGVSDVVLTPNQRRTYHNQRNTSKNHSGNMTSSTAAQDQIIPSMEHLEIGASPMPSTQKKRRPRKKTISQPDQINVPLPQSPPLEHSQAQGTPIRSMQQMYAGPTFHASPAPSSLPMPKFFSQAMQSNERVAAPVQTPSDESSEDSSSQGGGDSPTMRPSLRVLNNPPARESSPLDIFFNADRQEKARQGRTPSNLGQVDRAKSASPSHTANQSPPQSAFAKPHTPQADPNYAKTLALKQLLLFPQAQKSPSTLEECSSPFLDVPVKPAAVTRSNSESSTPTRSISGFNESPFGTQSSGQSFYDSPNLSTPPSSTRHPQIRRPLPHHLRQELLNSLPLDQSPSVSGKSTHFAPISRA